MIAIIDLACFGFSHEEFNAGTIYQIRIAHPDKKITYFAEKEQIKCVAGLVPLNDEKKGAGVSFQVLDELSDIGTEKKYNKMLYSRILNRIMKEYEDIKTMIFTSYTVECLPILYQYASQFIRECQCIFLLHGNFELLIKNNPIEKNSVYTLNPRFLIRQMQDTIKQVYDCIFRLTFRDILITRQYLKKLADLENVQFLAFSTAYLKYKKKINVQLYNKIEVIFLPYIFEEMEGSEDNFVQHNHRKIRIGLMPSTVASRDAIALKLILHINKHIEEKGLYRKYEFVFFNRWNQGIKNVIQYHNDDQGRENVRNFFRSCDWILLPYGKNKYVLSCSGILFDAINMEVPIIMYTSNCFKDFKDYGIGISGGGRFRN